MSFAGEDASARTQPCVTEGTILKPPDAQPRGLDPLRRWWVPVEKKNVTGEYVFRTHDNQKYFRHLDGSIHRAVPKQRGKAARRADKLARRKDNP